MKEKRRLRPIDHANEQILGEDFEEIGAPAKPTPKPIHIIYEGQVPPPLSQVIESGFGGFGGFRPGGFTEARYLVNVGFWLALGWLCFTFLASAAAFVLAVLFWGFSL